MRQLSPEGAAPLWSPSLTPTQAQETTDQEDPGREGGVGGELGTGT